MLLLEKQLRTRTNDQGLEAIPGIRTGRQQDLRLYEVRGVAKVGTEVFFSVLEV